MKNTRDLFRENLRAIITRKGLKLDKAAESCDISLSFLNQLLAGKTAYSPETLDKICKGLKCRPTELFFVEDVEKSETPREVLIALINQLPDGHVTTLINLANGLLGKPALDKKQSGG